MKLQHVYIQQLTQNGIVNRKKVKMINKDTIATSIGVGLAAVQATLIDWNKVFCGDPQEIMKVVFAFGLSALGYITNKGK